MERRGMRGSRGMQAPARANRGDRAGRVEELEAPAGEGVSEFEGSGGLDYISLSVL